MVRGKMCHEIRFLPPPYLGHYKTFLKTKQSWIVCNDEVVETQDDEDELRGVYEPSGYVYFYSRRYGDSHRANWDAHVAVQVSYGRTTNASNHVTTGERSWKYRSSSMGTQE